MIGIDWDPVVRAHGAREIGRLRAGRRLEISPDRAWRTVALASAPFRLGTRFRAVPDVRLYTGDALVASPGDQLPGPDDRSLDDYVARITGLGGGLGAGGFQLVVTDPLVLDFALWAEVRDLVRGLLARIGAPVLPVVCELVLGTFARTPRGFTKRMHCAVVTAVLAGRLRTRIWRRLWQPSPNEIRDFDAHRPDRVVTARAGDVVYCPADRWHIDEALAPCLALRLWIPAAGSDAGAEVARVISELAGRLDGDRGAVPYLPFPPRGPGAVPPELQRAGRRAGELARGPELARELAIRWARRVSACGLEPVPAAQAIALPPAARVRRDPGTPIVRMRWRGAAIWAANGHGFTLRSGERALHRIVRSIERRDATVAALCGDDPGLAAALAVLAEVRAITVTGDAPR